MDQETFPKRLAVDCLWLRRTLDTKRTEDPFLMLCTHIVRDGHDCIGPFLENIETSCQLWEPNERLASQRSKVDKQSAPASETNTTST